MSGEGYRVLLQARSWSRELRPKGFTWDQIADVIALTHHVNPLRLYRLAHGRTAADVVGVVNDADPAGTAALRDSRHYDYEGWPQAGRRPPAPLLVELARIYQTATQRLLPEEAVASYKKCDRGLISGADFHHLDVNRPAKPDRDSRVTAEGDEWSTFPGTTAVDAPACVRLLRAIDVEETDMRRRELLFELALVFGGGGALELLRVLTSEEEERLAGVLRDSRRLDEATVSTFEKLTSHARKVDEVSGPATLSSAIHGQRAAVERLLAREAMLPGLRDRLLNNYAQMSQLSGYFAYDLRDYAAAEKRLSDGLRAALDLGDPTLVGYVHYWMGRMAADQNRTAAIWDHALAVQSWAARSPSKLLTPLCESLFSLAHAAEGNAARSVRAHERALASAEAPKDNEPAFLHWVSPTAVESRRTGLLVQLNQPRDVIAAAESYLAGIARSSKGSWSGLAHEIGQAKLQLEPWANTTYVRQLDETLRSCGLTRVDLIPQSRS
ncbi:hypothetical protein [Nonomuraea insulae]|uniref:XRE family transcriptional regulator n=1 Tax=Nonomuraea insulae TaxID=1616787 RepID=A0ABW1CZ32_9ACTN